MFMDGPETSSDAETLGAAIIEHLPTNVSMTIFANLENATAVRQSFLANKEYLADAKKILPYRPHFTGDDIRFAISCRNKLDSGEDAVAKALAPLNVLHRKRYSEELEHTLATFLLDSDSSVQLTAERLFIHKNTVKYRLKCISDCFGFPVGQMPASFLLFEALAVRRLLKTE